MEELTKKALVNTGVKGRAVLRSKNFFALGLMSWMYSRPLASVEQWIAGKFGADSPVANANLAALRAGYNYGITTEEFHHTFEVKPASLPEGEYTNVTGNAALAWGLIAGARAADLPLFDEVAPRGAVSVTTSTGEAATINSNASFGSLSSGGLY